MTHTKDSITALLNRKDEAVIRALRTINSVCGWTQGEHPFASSLLSQMDDWNNTPPQRRYPLPLSDKQIAAARKLVIEYAGVLARVANDKAKACDRENAEGERQAERRQPRRNDDDEDGTRGRWAAEETANEIAYNNAGYNEIDW